MENLKCNPHHTELVNEFLGMLDIHPRGGFIDASNFSGNWELIGEEYPNKIKAINHAASVFIKYYPQKTKDYAQKVWDTLHQLAELPNLPNPILLPISICNGALVFESGEHIRTEYFMDLEGDAPEKIQAVVQQNGLDDLKLRDKIEIVRVGDTDYLVDPIEDSVWSISKYVEKFES